MKFFKKILPILLLSLLLTACGIINPLRNAPPPAVGTPLPVFVGGEPSEQIAPAYPPTVSQLPDPAGYAWVVYADEFARPVGVTHANDGTGRLFVLEQDGVIQVVEGDSRQPFLDIRDRIGREGNEQGLLGLAFHPDYASNGYFFVHYSDRAGDTVVARYRVSADPNLADPATEFRILQANQPYGNHNGGAIVFGPDGMLYLGLGDGGLANDPQGNAQNPDNFLGKLLRIDVSVDDNPETPYIVPADNPFVSGGGAAELWATGLRNPWRFAFDPVTNDLYIGDVGQNQWEEINFLPAGSPGGINFGWDYREGFHEFEGTPPSDLMLTDPVAEYAHDDVGGCSVTGGEVVRDPALSQWSGVYVYGDFCSGRVWGLLRTDSGWENALLHTVSANISSFGLGEDAAVYLTDIRGDLLKLVQK